MNPLAAGLSWIDLQFLGRPHAIATAIANSANGCALIDPGPATCRETLELALERQGVHWRDVSDILLTHIHLDHAGVTGELVREHPHLRVSVHERGAPHLIDPSKLVASATRLWGDDTKRLWGEILPVPETSLNVLRGGETVETSGRTFHVAYTPGHASHHVSYFDRDSGVAFVGDTAGVRVVSDGVIMPPTPPPDIDIPLWLASLTTIERWQPSTLFLTHFGPASAVGAHLSSLRENMEWTVRLGRESLAMAGEDAEREAWFVERLRSELRRRVGESAASDYEVSARLDLNWRGLARFLRKS